SRRRHTRSKRDWSSDVCSSDLCRAARNGDGRSDRERFGRIEDELRVARIDATMRSEERRVGKECRCRGSRGGGTEKGKKKKEKSKEEIQEQNKEREK